LDGGAIYLYEVYTNIKTVPSLKISLEKMEEQFTVTFPTPLLTIDNCKVANNSFR